MQPYKLSVDPIKLENDLSKFNSNEWYSTKSESAIILTSVGGTLNWDFAISGQIKPTIFLERCPYVKQILNKLDTPVARCRFTKLTEKQVHNNYHWFRHAIIYIPIRRNSTLSYNANEIQMNVGEAWIVDSQQPYSVTANTVLLAIEIPRNNLPNIISKYTVNIVPYQFEVLQPVEIEQLTATILAEIDERSPILITDIENFNRQWQITFSKFGHNATGELAYQDLIAYFNKEIFPNIRKHLSLNGAGNHAVNLINSMLLTLPLQPKRFSRTLLTKKRLQVKPTVHMDVAYQSLEREPNINLKPEQLNVLRACCSPANVEAIKLITKLKTDEIVTIVQKLLSLKLLTENFSCPKFDRPIFIISAPRAGSTLLFNTLSLFADLWTIGEESHELIEAIPNLHPSQHNFNSNRLTATDANLDAKITLQKRFVKELLNCNGDGYLNLPTIRRPNKIRFMEKTPKNALRIPFLKAVFPEAIFIYLYRDPRENINSMMEFWRSRRFIAYQNIPGWPYSNWSFLLTPGWEKFTKSSIAEIAAYQWQITNKYILSDLQNLPKSTWCFINYADLIQQPKATIRKISEFAELNWDEKVEQSLSNPLPISPMSLSAPAPDKWRKHEAEINKVVANIDTLQYQQLK